MVREACERAAGEEQGNSQTRGLPDILDLNPTPPCIAEQTQLEAPGTALTLYIVLLGAKPAVTLPCWQLAQLYMEVCRLC